MHSRRSHAAALFIPSTCWAKCSEAGLLQAAQSLLLVVLLKSFHFVHCDQHQTSLISFLIVWHHRLIECYMRDMVLLTGPSLIGPMAGMTAEYLAAMTRRAAEAPFYAPPSHTGDPADADGCCMGSWHSSAFCRRPNTHRLRHRLIIVTV